MIILMIGDNRRAVPPFNPPASSEKNLPNTKSSYWPAAIAGDRDDYDDDDGGDDHLHSNHHDHPQ